MFISDRMYNEFIADVLRAKAVCSRFDIEKVIFNDPATIIIWRDGTKTVVKCSENDVFDPEKGLAMAIAKKTLGNKSCYYETFKKWLPKEDTVTLNIGEDFAKTFREALSKCFEHK